MAAEKKTKTQMIAELNAIVSHPQFEAILKEIDEAPADARLATAERLATIKELQERKIPLADDFRISLRTFEGKDIRPEFDNPAHGQPTAPDTVLGSTTVCVSVGLSLCASVGHTVELPDFPKLPPITLNA